MQFLLSTTLSLVAVSAQFEGISEGRYCPTHQDTGDEVSITNCGDSCGADECVITAYDDATNPTSISCGCLPTSGDACVDPIGSIGMLGIAIENECAQDDCNCRYTDISKNLADALGVIRCACVDDESTDAPTEGPTEAPTDAPTDAPTEAPTPAPYQRPYDDCDRAYDDNDYCKCPEPREYPEDPELQEVSVCGDATYLLPASVDVCSGPADEDPAGTACPEQGDTTTIACRPEILSYLTGNSTGTCMAPEDGMCVQLNTGAWGCVFPGNCNTVNTCTEEPACNGDYEKDEDGQCIVGENGYPIAAENNTSLYETAELTELQGDSGDDSDSASSAALSVGATILAAIALTL